MRRVVLVFLGTVIALHADILTVPAQDGGSPELSFYPGFAQSFFFYAPAFDSTLGQLNSVTIDWQATAFSYEHLTILQIGTPFTYTYAQTMVVAINEKDVASLTQSDSFLEDAPLGSVGNKAVGIPFHMSGQSTITDYSNFVDIGSQTFFFVADIRLSGETLPNADSSEPGGAFLTDGFVTQVGSTFSGFEQADINYDYTPVPEPRGYAVLLILGVLVACVFARSEHKETIPIPWHPDRS